MKKFIYYLSEAPSYPNEIFAASADEVKQLIMQSVSSEDQILRIVEAEQQKTPAAEAAIYSDPDEYKDSKDFFNSVLKAGTAKVKKEEAVKKTQEDDAKNEKPVCAEESVKVEQPVVKIPPKYFEEAGIQFKLEDGKLFKRTWVNVSDGELPEFRIVSKSTNKIVQTDKYKIEKLEWTELQ